MDPEVFRENEPQTVPMKEQHMPWVPYVLSGIIGFALGAAVFAPVITPEYQRGHADGFRAGREDRTMHRSWYALGQWDHSRGVVRKFD